MLRSRGSGPWPERLRGLASIVEYTDDVAPANEYPERIVSPRRAAPCCALRMVNLADPQEANGWLFQYRRCPRCGFTVRRILRAIPDEALLAALRRTLAHAFEREEAA